LTGQELQDAVVELARFAGWRAAHFAPARTAHGWRTPCRYDAAGWPDLVLVRDRVVFVEIKSDRDRLRPDQAVWLQALGEADAEVHVWTSEEWLDGTVDAVLGVGVRR
jgi:hypothetical protein